MRRASRIWPIVLLILCAPVWQQIFALEIDLRAAELLGQPFGEIERRFSADIFMQIMLELPLKSRIAAHLSVSALQAPPAPASAFRQRSGRRKDRSGPADQAPLAAAINSLSLP